jgi:hypothetical protein
LLKRLLGEQRHLPVVDLARQRAAQVQIAVHHAVDHAQHQVGRLHGHLGADLAAVGLGGAGNQALPEVFQHKAAVGMHGQQYLVIQRKAHGLVSTRQHRASRWPLWAGLWDGGGALDAALPVPAAGQAGQVVRPRPSRARRGCR